VAVRKPIIVDANTPERVPAAAGGVRNVAVPAAMVRNVRALNRMVANLVVSRINLLKDLTDPRRNYEAEFGHPEESTAELYGRLYENDPYANRVVSVFPDECWSEPPEIYDSEKPGQTPFEARLADVDFKVGLLSALHQADVRCGIGRFGVIFYGLNDGKSPDRPVLTNEGVLRSNAKPLALNFVRVFDERVVSVASRVKDVASPRYGQPEYYNITFASVPDGGEISGATGKQTKVHWSRVQHIVDNAAPGELYGLPRQKPVLPRLLDLRKVLGSSAEMFYRGAMPGWAFETLPELAAESDMDLDSVREQYELWSNGLQRYLALDGVTAKSLAPQVASPKDHVTVQVNALCVALKIPIRVFAGSESGERASGQDAVTWNRRLAFRQRMHVTTNIINPCVARLVAYGVLPKPQNDRWFADWGDLNALGEKDKADVFLKRTQALLQYCTSGAETVMSVKHFLTLFGGLTREQTEAVIAETSDKTTKVWKKPEPAPGLAPRGGASRNGTSGAPGPSGAGSLRRRVAKPSGNGLGRK
jgi:hypothetical protein